MSALVTEQLRRPPGALPIEARAALAGSLVESLEIELGEDADAAWAIEVTAASPSSIAER